MQPGDADALAEVEAGRGARAQGGDLTHDLVAGDHALKALGQLALDHMKVGAADAAGAHAHLQLSRSGLGQIHLGARERLLVHRARMWQNPSLHPDSNIDAGFARVVEIMHRLRAPGGCPWDQKQTFDSIRAHTLEEAYEVLEAISDRDWPALREELGDLLLQVVFYAEMAEEEGRFNIQEVLQGLAEKLVRRHPHVFAEAPAGLSAEEALGRWNAAKAAEREAAGAGPASLMAGIPRGLPALAEAVKRGQRAAGVGFDWPAVEGVLAKLEEELGELRAEMAQADPAGLEEELGDLLFTVANLARHLGVEPESALKRANRKFRARFEAMEGLAAGRELAQLTPTQWDELWERAKAQAPQDGEVA